MDLLARKLEHGFSHLDRDGDGVLTEHDHVLMGESVAASFGHAKGSPQEQQIIDAYVRIWRDLHLPFVPAGAPGITKEQFFTSTRTLSGNPELAKATVGALAEAFLEIADGDGDGAVSAEEYHRFLRGHFPRLTRQATDHGFAILDADGDGVLSREEFMTAIIDFWTSNDPSARGNSWAGPLPEPGQ
jgi:Ca2+-binding EF-hand superfamily protein